MHLRARDEGHHRSGARGGRSRGRRESGGHRRRRRRGAAAAAGGNSIQFNSRGRFRRGRRQQWKIIAFQCFMHMSKMAVIIDMHIQFIADLAVLFGVQFCIIFDF